MMLIMKLVTVNDEYHHYYSIVQRLDITNHIHRQHSNHDHPYQQELDHIGHRQLSVIKS